MNLMLQDIRLLTSLEEWHIIYDTLQGDIIKILNHNNITFSEIKTFDEDLESIFIKITNESI